LVIKVVVEIPDSVMNELKKKGITEKMLRKDLEEVVKVIDKVKPSRIKKEVGA